ncbi:hypothetical protein D3C81_930300 [compost metagenome]
MCQRREPGNRSQALAQAARDARLDQLHRRALATLEPHFMDLRNGRAGKRNIVEGFEDGFIPAAERLGEELSNGRLVSCRDIVLQPLQRGDGVRPEQVGAGREDLPDLDVQRARGDAEAGDALAKQAGPVGGRAACGAKPVRGGEPGHRRQQGHGVEHGRAPI